MHLLFYLLEIVKSEKYFYHCPKTTKLRVFMSWSAVGNAPSPMPPTQRHSTHRLLGVIIKNHSDTF
jgi:hypothetical protein